MVEMARTEAARCRGGEWFDPAELHKFHDEEGRPSPCEPQKAEAAEPAATPQDPDVLDFSRPLAPQFGIEAVSRRVAAFRSKDLGNQPIAFKSVSLARVRCLEVEPLA